MERDGDFISAMPFNKKSIKAVIFDYGNTLIEFSKTQIMYCDAALANTLDRHFGKPDFAKFSEIRNRNRLAPYSGNPPEYKENNMVEISTNLVRELYGVEPSPEQLADILHTRLCNFCESRPGAGLRLRPSEKTRPQVPAGHPVQLPRRKRHPAEPRQHGPRLVLPLRRGFRRPRAR